MKNLFYTGIMLITIALLSSCGKAEFEPRVISNSFDTTLYINPVDTTIQDYYLCNYPFYNWRIDATGNDTSATYLWEPGGETTSTIEGVNLNDYLTLHYFSDSTGPVQFIFDFQECSPAIYIPSAFTPGGDNLSERWRPFYNGLTSIYYEIRDSDGIKVFSTDNLNSDGWDGKYKSNYMPHAFYLYYINYSTLESENNIKTGSLELIR